MTGQGLYAQWMAANGEANTHVDGWELLEDIDRQIWESMARRVARAYPTVDIGLSASLTESIINNLQEASRAEHGISMMDRGYYIDEAMTKVRALRSLLLLKETQAENARANYRGAPT
jgi:hypothetical protein